MDTKKKRPTDVNALTFQIVQEATGQEIKPSPVPAPEPAQEKNPAAVALGRLGGLKGGKARAKALSSKRRKEIAREAAKIRWSK